MYRKIDFLRGDTLIEVMFAVGIFGIVAVSAISLMNRGVNTAQTALETTMARNEIDAQAEALRFIHDAYAAEIQSANKEYGDLWGKITGLALASNDVTSSDPTAIITYPNFMKYPSEIASCVSEGDSDFSAAYTNGVGIVQGKSFIVNTHALDASSSGLASTSNILFRFNQDDHNSASEKLLSATTYPRLIFNESANLGDNNYSTALSAAEGIWVTAVKSAAESTSNPGQPQYYDFYIRTCWNPPGQPPSQRPSAFITQTPKSFYGKIDL